MARIAFLTTMSGYPWGGSETLWSKSALHLSSLGHQISVSVYDWDCERPALTKLKNCGVVVHERPLKLTKQRRILNKILGTPLGADVKKWLNWFKPDLVLISQGDNLSAVPWMNLCLELKYRFAVVTQANYEWWWPDDAIAEYALPRFNAAERSFFVSNKNYELICRQLAGSLQNVEIISNPFLVSLHPSNTAIDYSGSLRLACVARLEPKSKGQDLLFELFAMNKWRSRPIQLSLYGAGPSEKSLRRLAKSLDLQNVFFEGSVSEIEGIWRNNHAIILPSRLEGTPLALIEAMICSRFGIVTDVGGSAELVEDNVSGFVAAAPTVKLLDDALERAWQRVGDWEAIGVASRTKILSRIPHDPVGHFSERLLTCL